ncbi:MAG: sulfatase-like hydrolase/transferase [Treponema sp.]|nr:sulfatase-like hydrolase/transferase [Treponema sp.]
MKPNFLFLFPDQHRGDWMPYNDNVFKILQTEKPQIRMPNVGNLMRKGTSFYRCITPSPLCAPARACLASGRHYENCRVPGNEFDYPVDMESFYSVLRDNGYSVGGTGKFDLHKVALDWGLDGWVDDLGKIGFTAGIDSEGKWDAIQSLKKEPPGPKGPYMKFLKDNGLLDDHVKDMMTRRGPDNRYNVNPTTLPDYAYGDNWAGSNGVRMLHNFPKDKPWFLQVNFPGPHEPWDITKSMKERWKDAVLPAADRGVPENAAALGKVRQNYAAMLENIDAQIGLLLDEVEKRGETDNTIFIYSSDHGEMLGDVGLFFKSLPDRASVHIPLVFAGKGIRENTVSGALAELTDLPATILDFAGITVKFHEAVSMRSVLNGKTDEYRDCVQSALADWKVVIDKRYKTIFRNGKAERKYDTLNDPWERNNLI